MHPSTVTGKRPPLSPQEGWLSDGRQVLHFNPVRYSRYSQALELTSGELIPCFRMRAGGTSGSNSWPVVTAMAPPG